MVWRGDGTNRVARSLLTLFDQVDAHYPGRAIGNDGTIGNAAHQATKSDHNPDEHGIVRALDITHDPAHGFDSYKFADFLRENWDDRVQYLISNSRIANVDAIDGAAPMAWRYYGGGSKDPHDHHIHISARHDPRADDARPWDIGTFLDGASSPPDPPSVPFAPLDQETIDAIASAAAASELARYTWSGHGRAPIGYVQGLAIVYGQEVRYLAAGDSFARTMVRVVNGPGDVFDHYQSILVAAGMPTRGAPDIDRLRALFVILTGLGIRESSGGDDIGRDTTASNTTADTAEAGTWQQSWDSRGANPELSTLFGATVGSDPDVVDEIFKRGTSPKSSAFQNFGDPDSDGYKFQALVKARPSVAALFAAIAMRTLRGLWGPLNRHEVEIVPAADALFRKVQDLVGMASPAPAPKPIPTAPTPPWVAKPSFPGAIMDDKVKLTMITEICKPAPDTKALHLMLLDAPVIPVPPGTPPANPPIVAVPPVVPAPPSGNAANWSAAISAALAALGLGGAGVIGLPAGPDFSMAGLISVIGPLVLAGAWPKLKEFFPGLAKP